MSRRKSKRIVSTEANRLTDIQVRNAKPDGDKARYLIDGKGLYLIARGGSRNWLYRYTLDGKAHTMGLGGYPDVSLADAREAASAARKMLKGKDRSDPLALRHTEREQRRAEATAHTIKAMTFDACAAQYVVDNQARWRNEKVRWQWSNTLKRFASPIIGKMPVADIDTAAIQKVLAPIWNEIPETASKLRGRIEKILDWAKVMKLREGENPAAWKGNLQSLFPSKSQVRAVEHHPALPYADLPAFMTELRERESVGARALEFTILTAARTGETLGATWGEIDLEARMWVIPVKRMKMKREHRVPLCARALEILKEMRKLGRKADGFIFPGRDKKPLSNMVMTMLLRRMGYDDLTVHGFRSTFRDWCAEQTTVANEVPEMALAHAVSSAVEAAYRRGDMFDRRRALADDWANYATKDGAKAA